jgi:NADPH2:quinone reductase
MNIGSYAEYAVIPAWRAVRVPEGMQLETAAAAYVQGSTAYYLSHWVRQLGPGDTCLIQAAPAASARSWCSCEDAGARVLTTVGSPQKAELVRALGAMLVILYHEVDFARSGCHAGPRRRRCTTAWAPPR